MKEDSNKTQQNGKNTKVRLIYSPPKTDRLTTRMKKKIFIDAMFENKGHITNSCKIANIDRATYYRWLEKDKKLAQLMNDVNESIIDFAEEMLMQQMKDGSPASTIFFLKTKAKHRGYIEGLQITGGEQQIKNVIFGSDPFDNLEGIEDVEDLNETNETG